MRFANLRKDFFGELFGEVEVNAVLVNLNHFLELLGKGPAFFAFAEEPFRHFKFAHGVAIVDCD